MWSVRLLLAAAIYRLAYMPFVHYSLFSNWFSHLFDPMKGELSQARFEYLGMALLAFPLCVLAGVGLTKRLRLAEQPLTGWYRAVVIGVAGLGFAQWFISFFSIEFPIFVYYFQFPPLKLLIEDNWHWQGNSAAQLVDFIILSAVLFILSRGTQASPAATDSPVSPWQRFIILLAFAQLVRDLFVIPLYMQMTQANPKIAKALMIAEVQGSWFIPANLILPVCLLIAWGTFWILGYFRRLPAGAPGLKGLTALALFPYALAAAQSVLFVHMVDISPENQGMLVFYEMRSYLYMLNNVLIFLALLRTLSHVLPRHHTVSGQSHFPMVPVASKSTVFTIRRVEDAWASHGLQLLLALGLIWLICNPLVRSVIGGLGLGYASSMPDLIWLVTLLLAPLLYLAAIPLGRKYGLGRAVFRSRLDELLCFLVACVGTLHLILAGIMVFVPNISCWLPKLITSIAGSSFSLALGPYLCGLLLVGLSRLNIPEDSGPDLIDGPTSKTNRNWAVVLGLALALENLAVSPLFARYAPGQVALGALCFPLCLFVVCATSRYPMMGTAQRVASRSPVLWGCIVGLLAQWAFVAVLREQWALKVTWIYLPRPMANAIWTMTHVLTALLNLLLAQILLFSRKTKNSTPSSVEPESLVLVQPEPSAAPMVSAMPLGADSSPAVTAVVAEKIPPEFSQALLLPTQNDSEPLPEMPEMRKSEALRQTLWAFPVILGLGLHRFVFLPLLHVLMQPWNAQPHNYRIGIDITLNLGSQAAVPIFLVIGWAMSRRMRLNELKLKPWIRLTLIAVAGIGLVAWILNLASFCVPYVVYAVAKPPTQYLLEVYGGIGGRTPLIAPIASLVLFCALLVLLLAPRDGRNDLKAPRTSGGVYLFVLYGLGLTLSTWFTVPLYVGIVAPDPIWGPNPTLEQARTFVLGFTSVMLPASLLVSWSICRGTNLVERLPALVPWGRGLAFCFWYEMLMLVVDKFLKSLHNSQHLDKTEYLNFVLALKPLDTLVRVIFVLCLARALWAATPNVDDLPTSSRTN